MQPWVSIDCESIITGILVGSVTLCEDLELDDIIEWHWIMGPEYLMNKYFMRVDPVDYLVLHESDILVNSKHCLVELAFG